VASMQFAKDRLRDGGFDCLISSGGVSYSLKEGGDPRSSVGVFGRDNCSLLLLQLIQFLTLEGQAIDFFSILTQRARAVYQWGRDKPERTTLRVDWFCAIQRVRHKELRSS